MCENEQNCYNLNNSNTTDTTPDEYFVEGIDIDCKSAFESYEKRKKLREKHSGSWEKLASFDSD